MKNEMLEWLPIEDCPNEKRVLFRWADTGFFTCGQAIDLYKYDPFRPEQRGDYYSTNYCLDVETRDGRPPTHFAIVEDMPDP